MNSAECVLILSIFYASRLSSSIELTTFIEIQPGTMNSKVMEFRSTRLVCVCVHARCVCVCTRMADSLKIITFAWQLNSKLYNEETMRIIPPATLRTVCDWSRSLCVMPHPICPTGFWSEWRDCLSTCESLCISPKRYALVWFLQDVFSWFF